MKISYNEWIQKVYEDIKDTKEDRTKEFIEHYKYDIDKRKHNVDYTKWQKIKNTNKPVNELS